MKNYEKYADEIRKYKGVNFGRDFIKPYILKKNNCAGITCNQCNMLQTIWLLEEYEEPEVDWSKVEVDTPILVRDSEGSEWVKRYFAEYEGGKIYAWTGGKTSWTEEHMTGWNYAKLAESEEE